MWPTASRSNHPSAECQPLLVHRAWRQSQRPTRVVVLVVGIIVLSMADLVITLAYLRANWMMEANPIAAYLIKTTQSGWVLAAFKSCTVMICASLLLKLRAHLAGEVAAWCAVAILAGMSVMWHRYAQHLEDPSHMMISQVGDDYRLGLP